MQPRAALAILEDLVRQLRFVFDHAESKFEEEVRNARKQAHGLNAVLFRLFNQSTQNASACALPLGFGLHYDRTHFRQMRPVEMQRTAAKKHAAIGFGEGEVANVLAYLSERALEQRAVAGERVHQVVNVRRIVQKSLTYPHGQPPA